MKPEPRVREESIKEGVKVYMHRICNALNTDDHEEATQAIISFGAFLQDKYPGLGLDDLRKQAGRLIKTEFNDLDMPNLDFIKYFFDARIRTYQAIVELDDTPDQNRLYKMDAANKGVNIFSQLLGDDRWENALKISADQELDESYVIVTQKFILESPYKLSENVSKVAQQKLIADNLVTEIRVNMNETMNGLTQQIKAEVQKNPDLYQGYSDGEELDIPKLVTHLNESPESGTYSPEIKMAAASYDALQTLNNTVNEAGTSQQRLGRFQAHLKNDSIKSVLDSNPDDGVTRFLKIASYIIKCAVTLTAYHWITEGKSLRSIQQESLKEALQSLKKAEDNNVIEPPKLA